MPRRNDIHRILLLGSGPIRIGQAAEFDFSGSQACRALREDGFEVILVKDGPVNDEAEIIISNFEADLKRKQIIFKLQAFSENIGHGNARRSGIEITSATSTTS